ncbi:MAG TPA: hypothetical protein VMW27_29295 [Thermoanaerobaculia bacterium]|nr:hypothetical protein [Thermoanaerobaculia bacterium]
MDHRIDASMVGGLLVVNPDPFPGRPDVTVRPGDTVTWIFDPSVGPGELHVGFEFAQDLPLSGNARKNVGPMGPFESISRDGNTITGTVGEGVPEDPQRIWRYFCKIFKDGLLIKGNFESGLDAARKPPP